MIRNFFKDGTLDIIGFYSEENVLVPRPWPYLFFRTPFYNKSFDFWNVSVNVPSPVRRATVTVPFIKKAYRSLLFPSVPYPDRQYTVTVILPK